MNNSVINHLKNNTKAVEFSFWGITADVQHSVDKAVSLLAEQDNVHGKAYTPVITAGKQWLEDFISHSKMGVNSPSVVKTPEEFAGDYSYKNITIFESTEDKVMDSDKAYMFPRFIGEPSFSKDFVVELQS